MKCPRCLQEFEGASCPSCGAVSGEPQPPPRPTLCPRCGTGFFGNYCPYCGWTPLALRYVLPERRVGLREIFAVVWLLAISIFLVIVAMNLVGFLYASTLIVPGILEGSSQACGSTACVAVLYFISPFPFSAGEGELTLFLAASPLRGVYFLFWFFLIFAAVMAVYSFLIWKDGYLTFKDLRSGTSALRAQTHSSSSWITVAQVYMALVFFDLVYLLIALPLAGIQPTGPELENIESWYIYYALVNASVYEELLMRVFYLGLLLLPLHLALGRRPLKLRSYFFGRDFRMEVPTAVLLVFSSILFGLAHVIGGGWDSWKLVDASVAGLGLGYLFLRRGLVSSVLLHFTVNGLGVLTLILMDSPIVALLAILFLVSGGLGALFFFHYAREAYLIAMRRLGFRGKEGAREEPRKVVTTDWTRYYRREPTFSPKVAPEAQPFFFQCKKCGWMEARYIEGRLQCTKCGADS